MTDRFIDPGVGARAFEALSRQLARGCQRVVVFGPAGVGKSTLLSRLEGVAAFDAPSVDEAREALAKSDRAIVVAAETRSGLEADAFVELAPMPIDDGSDESALAFLRRLLARDGTDGADEAALRAVAAHTEGLPGAVRRAAELLRLMPPDAIAARCRRADDELSIHGVLVDRPLAIPAGAALEEALVAPALALAIAVEPLPLELAERWIPDGDLDTLLALRDRGALALADEGRVLARRGLLRELSARPTFREDFDAAAERLDAEVLALASAARERWASRGDEAALAAIGEHEGRIRRAAERALARPDHAAERIVESVLALRARNEVHVGPRAEGELLARACEALGDAPAGCAVKLERAKWLRQTGDIDAMERLLATLDASQLEPALASKWHLERALAYRHRRELDRAIAHLEKARAISAASGAAHDEARITLDLGAVRYWQTRFDEALARYAEGRAMAARLGATRTEAIALSNMCLCYTMSGDELAAREHGEQAVALFRTIGDPGAVGTTLGHLGILAYQYGRYDDAERDLSEAEALVERAGYFEQRVYVRFNRACVALAAGRTSEAEEQLRSFPALLAASPSAFVSAHLSRLESDLREHEARFAEARAALDRGLALAVETGSTGARAQLGSQLARVLARMGEHEESRRAEQSAREALASVTRAELTAPCELALDHATHLRGEPADTQRLADALRPAWEGHAARARIGVSALDSGAVRAAAAAFWADLGRSERVAIEWAARDPGMSAVCVDADGERARVPGGAMIEASARRNAFRLLRLLADAGADGEERDALIEATWPGEQMLGDAALNRLHNALAQLRSAGLAPHLSRSGERYRLEGVRVIHAGRDDPFVKERAERRSVPS